MHFIINLLLKNIIFITLKLIKKTRSFLRTRVYQVHSHERRLERFHTGKNKRCS